MTDSTWFIAAVNSATGNNGVNPLYACRGYDQFNVGYFVQGQGCVFTFGGVQPPIASFQILTGTGFSWSRQEQAENTPANAYQIGVQAQYGKLYLGRCNIHNTGNIGKVTNGFFYNNNGNEASDCDWHDTLVCVT